MSTGISDTQSSTFASSNSVALSAQKDSKILNVSVYTGRAEITRLFKLTARAGLNKVTISDLPTALDPESLRVDGKGEAMIQDVTLFNVTAQPEAASPRPTTSPELERLEKEHMEVMKALDRASNSVRFFEDYLKNASARELEVSALSAINARYEYEVSALDKRVIELQIKKSSLWSEGEIERRRLPGPPPAFAKSSLQAVVGILADVEGEVELALIYATKGIDVSWAPAYDVLVTTKTKEAPIIVKYKAIIKQRTGEDWVSVPITLETTTPTFGAAIPKLHDWKLTVPPPPVPFPQDESRGTFRAFGSGAAQPAMSFGASAFGSTHTGTGLFGAVRSAEVNAEESRLRAASFANPPAEEGFRSQGSEVSAEGSINASFKVPGLLTIRSGPVAHDVTIVKLSLDATLQWLAVPKAEINVHITGNIKNTSEYSLLKGPANVYLDGSFVARSTVPHTYPDQSFDCALGLDKSIGVTYHPLNKKVTDKGFFSKFTTHLFSRRITVHNYKTIPVENIAIFDHIPVSENGVITVKLVSPALELPAFGATRAPNPVKVSEGVIALWEGADDPVDEADEAQAAIVAMLGRKGKLKWKCVLPAQGKVDLTLQWEVSAPLGTKILGL